MVGHTSPHTLEPNAKMLGHMPIWSWMALATWFRNQWPSTIPRPSSHGHPALVQCVAKQFSKKVDMHIKLKTEITFLVTEEYVISMLQRGPSLALSHRML